MRLYFPTAFSLSLSLLLSGCASVGLDPSGSCFAGVVEHPSQPEIYSCDPEGLEIEHYERWFGRYLHVYDATLAILGLPPLSDHADSVPIHIERRPEGGRIAGLYCAYDRLDCPVESIYLWPKEPGEHWGRTAIGHEWWHLYEWREFGLTTEEWVEISAERDRHFATGAVGPTIFNDAERVTLETAWECEDYSPLSPRPPLTFNDGACL